MHLSFDLAQFRQVWGLAIVGYFCDQMRETDTSR